jgi:hypothetical protein
MHHNYIVRIKVQEVKIAKNYFQYLASIKNLLGLSKRYFKTKKFVKD